jgi:hypothetical protein
MKTESVMGVYWIRKRKNSEGVCTMLSDSADGAMSAYHKWCLNSGIHVGLLDIYEKYYAEKVNVAS